MDQKVPVRIEPATLADVPLILSFVRELADYERLADSVTVNAERLTTALFGSYPYAKSVIAYRDQEPIAFAIYYFNYSSFSGLPGLYLEDIFVRPAERGNGVGLQMFRYLSQEAIERGCGRMEWAVLNWNENAVRFYQSLSADALEGWTTYRLPANLLAHLANKA